MGWELRSLFQHLLGVVTEPGEERAEPWGLVSQPLGRAPGQSPLAWPLEWGFSSWKGESCPGRCGREGRGPEALRSSCGVGRSLTRPIGQAERPRGPERARNGQNRASIPGCPVLSSGSGGPVGRDGRARRELGFISLVGVGQAAHPHACTCLVLGEKSAAVAPGGPGSAPRPVWRWRLQGRGGG